MNNSYKHYASNIKRYKIDIINRLIVRNNLHIFCKINIMFTKKQNNNYIYYNLNYILLKI